MPSGFKADRNRLIIPEFQEGIKFRDKSSTPDGIMHVIITKEMVSYYASIQYESCKEPVNGKGITGIDMEIKPFLQRA